MVELTPTAMDTPMPEVRADTPAAAAVVAVVGIRVAAVVVEAIRAVAVDRQAEVVEEVAGQQVEGITEG
jgi:hypothetical protein